MFLRLETRTVLTQLNRSWHTTIESEPFDHLSCGFGITRVLLLVKRDA